MKRYRNEWKYLADSPVAVGLQQKIAGILTADSHTLSDGAYSVHSLYFDDVYDTCARTNISGDGVRFKYRIRFYNKNPDYLLLEKKEKYNAYCHKRTTRLSIAEYDLFMNGSADRLLWDEDLLKRDFAIDIIRKGFMPKVIINYKRYAFTEPITNVRITFDEQITASDDFDNFFRQEGILIPVIQDNSHVVEVKFDNVLPAYIRKVIQSTQLNQQAFSKYYMGRIAVNKYMNI
jgi:hypothetical protein